MNVNLDSGLQDNANKVAFKDRKNFINLCKTLASRPELERLIHATRISAQKHVRQSYKDELLRKDTVSAAHPESKLERAVWLKWGLHKKSNNNPTFLDECPHIVSYQVPLFNKKLREGWGYVDAIGVSRKDLIPVVIELKASGSDESVLRMVLEAVAYGIALQEAWGPRFRQDWQSALTELAQADRRLINQESLSRLPHKLVTCQIICGAPTEYWDYLEDDGKRGDFKKILGHLHNIGFPVSFAKLDFKVGTFVP